MDRGSIVVNGVFSHSSRICGDIVRFSLTNMATPEAALKLEIARLTGICLLLLWLMFSLSQSSRCH
jgi:hypothetical protein